MARWTTLAVLTLTLLLLAQELHCQSDDGSAQTRTTKTSRRRFRKVRRQQVRTAAADGEEGNEVHYQRSRVASTTDGDSSGSSSSSSAAFVPGRGSRRRYTSRVSVRRRTSAAQPGATQPPVLEGSYFLPPGEEGGRRVFAWKGGRTAGVAGAGAAGVRTSGDSQSPPAAASPVVSRTYSSSYYYRSSGGDAAAEQQTGSSSAEAAGASYRGEPGFAGQPGSLSNVERSTFSRRVTYGTTSGGIPCADAASCAAAAAAAAAAQSAAQAGFSQEQVSQSQSQSGYGQKQTSQSQSQSQTGYSQQQTSQSQSQLTAQQRAAARAAAYARRQQEYARRRQEYARRQQQSSYEGSQYGRTRQQGGRGYGRRYGYGRGRGRGRQQGVSEETATYDRTFAGRTYDRTRGRDETEGGSTVVTRYPGRTVYRNSTGTYVTSTRTLPGGRTVTSFNYTERYPSPGGGGVVTAVNRTSFRNRTVVTTTSQQVPSGGSTGSTVTYRNISSVTSYPQGGAPQVQRQINASRPEKIGEHWNLVGPFGMDTSVEQAPAHLYGRITVKMAQAETESQQACERGSCLPASGNLLIGREARLSASSTCGSRGRERYCIVSHLEDKKKCFWCDSRPKTAKKLLLNHQSRYAVRATQVGAKGYRRLTWWQAENGVESVSLQLDLEAEFHFTHLIMKFKTFRPKAMLIERSYDFGETWHVYRYYAHSCAAEFPNVRKGSPRSMSEVVCQERYSKVQPSARGEVIFRALPPRLTPKNPYADEVQNLLKITNLRVNFTRLHTLGDDLLDNRREIKEKYYYAVYEMVVAGRCSCYGHAPRCLPLDGVDAAPEMVHGRCECIHNTQGLNCEKCLDFHHDLPWKPAVGKETNACKRCNCNGHSSSCHFDPARYNQTGFVSGGICDDCRHNTEGYNCELCKTRFFRVPGLDPRDPNICRACECDERGSLYDGVCESVPNEELELPAGHCHCKEKVTGPRCDRCVSGYWNFTSENPAGCQECTCNPLGTLPDVGCDQLTGHCNCKRNVVGRNCDQCPEQFWGLSEHEDGCKPCNCDPGGAYDNICDVVSGQCKCRPNLTGLTCSEPKENFYGGLLDYLVYEAETANADERSQAVVREPFRDGRRTSWTGPGFMRVFENSFVEFDVENVERSLDYDLVVRYEPQTAAAWDNVQVTVFRDPEDPIDPAGQCGAVGPGDDVQQLVLPSDRRHITGYPPVCLEQGKKYKIRLEFQPFTTQEPGRNIGTLIDSIALIPRVTELPYFGSEVGELRRREFDHFRCAEYFYQAHGSRDMPEACKKHMASIGYYVFEGAKDKPCGCDPTGSESTLCDQLGGQCRCKVNVVGRRCDSCAPGTYGFGPEGCTACDCNAVGSLDNFCNATTGQCKCRPNTYGRPCDECQPGFWNYPNCERCDCNGHAPTCHHRTGVCIDCADYTTGDRCDLCADSYYGDPRLGVDIPCRPCPCPDTVESGHSFADRCYLEPASGSVICQCQPGYNGSQCDYCEENYFGSPETPGGDCRPCDCSNNMDPARPGNCDRTTGECLQCLFNTSGFNCGVCAAGYYGDAIERTCQECVCNMLGTDASAGPCNPGTGQCNCLPNVQGRQCDRCVTNHWKIAIGNGCEPCACDSVGSLQEQCNEFDGQCQCKPGFGGRRCNQCQDNHWGNPRVECFPCDCNPYGSESQQCDRDTGLCTCKEGMGGNKCDQCARGFKGQAPYCDACGECFDNWDRILTELRVRTDYLVSEASKIKQGGASGAYQGEFEQMQEWLDQVRSMLGNATVEDNEVDRLQATIDAIRTNLTESESLLSVIESSVDDTTQRVLVAELQVAPLRGRADTLRQMALLLKENATLLQEANVDGALESTRQAKRRSEAAEQSVKDTERTLLSEAERQRRRTENLLSRAGQQFNQSEATNQDVIDQVNGRLDAFEREIPGINGQVCDGEGDPCDALCGGAGCNRCGGISCDDGAVTKAANALSVAEDAAAILTDREREVDNLFRGVSAAQRAADEAYNLAQMALTGAELNHNRTQETKLRVEELLIQITEFLSNDGASPEAIQRMAEQTLEKSISLRPEQITELARQINETISSLTNIQAILDETEQDLANARALKVRADTAKAAAEGILQTAQSVIAALGRADTAQQAAREAMESAETNIQLAEADLTAIASEAGEASRQANQSLVDVTVLRVRQKDLIREFSRNELDVRAAVKEADLASDLAGKAQTNVAALEEAYQKAIDQLGAKSEASGAARERAGALLERATKLALLTQGQVSELNEMQSEFSRHEIQLEDLSMEVMALNARMDDYLATITKRHEYYRTCQS